MTIRLRHRSVLAGLCVLLTACAALALTQSTEANPAVFVVTSRDGTGIRIGPPVGLGPPVDILDMLHVSARTARIDLRIVAVPEQADCIVTLRLNEVHSGAAQVWTLIDAGSGTLLEDGRARSVRIAVHDAVRAVGRQCT